MLTGGIGEQARGLRAAPAELGRLEASTGRGVRVIAVASGKGGVGKTNVTANLGIALARRGRRVVVLDADVGLGNIDLLLGLVPRRTIAQVLAGECTVEDVLVEGPGGVQILPAGSGIAELVELDYEGQHRLQAALNDLSPAPEVILLDVGAGIGGNVQFFAAAAQELVVVITPQPTAIADAYALIKVLARKQIAETIGLVVNMAASAQDAGRAFQQLNQVVTRFLPGVVLTDLGWLPQDRSVNQAERQQQAVVEVAPRAAVSEGLQALADRVDRGIATPVEGDLRVPLGGWCQRWWSRAAGIDE